MCSAEKKATTVYGVSQLRISVEAAEFIFNRKKSYGERHRNFWGTEFWEEQFLRI